MKFRSHIINHFGVEAKPWHGAAFRRVAASISGAMADGLMLALIGGPGSGKKTLLRYCMQRQPERDINVYIQVMDDTRIRIAQIIAQMITDISDGAEKPRRDAYGKKGQLARLLYFATEAGRGVHLIIEQGQHLHHATIRAIKELHELSFLGKTEMFSVVMSGHRKLRGTLLGMKDVAQRVELEELSEDNGWMGASGRADYLRGRFGDLLNETMRENIASYCRTPLQMDSLVYGKMKDVYLRGDNAFKESDFLLDLKGAVEKNGIKYPDICRVSGYQKSTVSQVLNGNYDRPETVDRVREAIEELIHENKTHRAAG